MDAGIKAIAEAENQKPVAYVYEFWADRGHKGLSFEEECSADNTPLYAHPFVAHVDTLAKRVSETANNRHEQQASPRDFDLWWSESIKTLDVSDTEDAYKGAFAAWAACQLQTIAKPSEEPVAFRIYKPTPPRLAIPSVTDAELPWVYDQDPSSGRVASMWVTPVATLPKREPQDWSVFSTGAEVASGLTFDEAWDYMTDERLARGWSAVCVVNKDNMPIETASGNKGEV